MPHDSPPDMPAGSGGSSSDRHPDLRWADAFLLGDWRVEPRHLRISRGDEIHDLPPRLMDLLVCLALRPGEAYTHRDLIDLVWKTDDVDENELTQTINDLRELLDDDPDEPRYIETVGHEGYRLIAAVRPVSPGASAGAGFSPEQLRPRRPGARLWRDTLLWRTFGVIVILIGLGLAFLRGDPRDEGPRDETTGPRVTSLTDYPGDERDPALSPGGTDVAFAWTGSEGGDYDIYVKRDGREEPVRVTRNPGPDVHPVWSPDGRELIYEHVESQGTTLIRASVDGGQSEKVLTTRRALRGFDWAPDGKHVVYAEDRLRVLDLQTGQPRDLTGPSTPDDLATDPVCSPDGRRVAFLRRGPGDKAEVHVVGIEGGPSRRVAGPLRDVKGLAWTSDGSALRVPASVSGDHALWRLPVEGGEPTSLPLQVQGLEDPSGARETDRMVYRHAPSQNDIWRIDFTTRGRPAGESWRLIASEHEDREPQISPDGRRVAFTSTRSGSQELWMCSRDGLDPVQLTALGDRAVSRPRWSPDGLSLGFNSADETGQWLHRVNLDGLSTGLLPERIATDHANTRVASFSRDGQWMYFGSDHEGAWDLWRVDLNDGETTRVTEEGAIVGYESPDGLYLYYTRVRQAGLWRLPLPLDPWPKKGDGVYAGLPAIDHWDLWGVVQAGVILLQRNDRETKLRLLSPEGMQTLANIFLWPGTGFTVSQAGDMMLYDRAETQDGDLRLIDGID